MTMKPGMIVAVVALVCATMGVVLGKMFAAPPADSGVAAELSSLERSLDQIGARLKTLEVAQEDLSVRLQNSRSGPVRIANEDIEQVVQRYLAGHAGAEKVAAATSVTPATAAQAAPSTELPGLLAQLLDPELPYGKREAIYAKLKEQGLLDEAIAQVEKQASGTKDADQHVALADLYLQKLFTVNDGPERGTWATRADEEFDRALETNPNHWQARFSKAVSLSFWPPIFGKQEEAAKQFETLIGQQEKSNRRDPEQASSYLFLGNLYAQMGKTDQAKETWRKGLALFPDSAELKAKLEP